MSKHFFCTAFFKADALTISREDKLKGSKFVKHSSLSFHLLETFATFSCVFPLFGRCTNLWCVCYIWRGAQKAKSWNNFSSFRNFCVSSASAGVWALRVFLANSLPFFTLIKVKLCFFGVKEICTFFATFFVKR